MEMKTQRTIAPADVRATIDRAIGNLLDNACKWAKSQVRIEVVVERAAADDPMPMVRIIVDDDGRVCADVLNCTAHLEAPTSTLVE